MSTSLTDLINGTLAIPEWSIRLGFAGTMDSNGTDHFRDVEHFKRSNMGRDEVLGAWVDKYDLSETSSDRERKLDYVDNTTGDVFHDGADWAFTGGGVYRYFSVKPSRVRDAAKLIPTETYERKTIPLTVLEDGDMGRSDVDYWDGTSGSSSATNLTPTKGTDPADALFGDNALILTATGASGVEKSQKFRVTGGKTLYTPIIGRADVGTITLALWDVTNGAYINASQDVAYSGEQSAFMERTDQLPATCEEVQVVFKLTGASDRAVVGQVFGPYLQGQNFFVMPSTIDATFKLTKVRATDFRLATNTTGVADATSRRWIGDLVGRKPQDETPDYTVEIVDRAANPNRLQFNDTQNVTWALGKKPLWLSVERLRSDAGETLATEASTTTMPYNEALAHFHHNLALMFQALQPNNSEWDKLVQDTAIEAMIEEFVRPPDATVINRRQYMSIRA